MFPGTLGGRSLVATPVSVSKRPPAPRRRAGRVWGDWRGDGDEWWTPDGASTSGVILHPPESDSFLYAGGSDGRFQYLLSVDDSYPNQLWVSKFDALFTTRIDRWEVTGWTGNPLGDDFHSLSYTGSVQTLTVPDGYDLAVITAYSAGAVGGADVAHVEATFPVAPGDALNVYVGGAAGWPDGGAGNPTGAGSSSVRYNGTSLADRILVAGGPGGFITSAGHGGAPDGGDADTADGGGYGGTTSAGGAGGSIGGFTSGSPGSSGQGGAGGGTNGGGGGGGYYGGGGGADNGEGGGGGSSYVDPAGTSVLIETRPASDVAPAYNGAVTVTFTTSDFHKSWSVFSDNQPLAANASRVAVVATANSDTGTSLEVAVLNLTGSVVDEWSIATLDTISSFSGACLDSSFVYVGLVDNDGIEKVAKINLASGTRTDLFLIADVDAAILAADPTWDYGLIYTCGIVEVGGDLIIGGYQGVVRVQQDGTPVWWHLGQDPSAEYRGVAHSGRGSVWACDTSANADEYRYDGTYVQTITLPEYAAQAWFGP